MSADEFKTPYKPRGPRPRPNRSGETPQPWTTARCQRLLRPLLSKLASLRKDTATCLQNPSSDELKQETGAGAEQQSANCEWLGPRKRVRLTYSQKRNSRYRDCQSTSGKELKGPTAADYRHDGRWDIPGEIVAATPLLRRARGHVVPSPAAPTNSVSDLGRPIARCRQDSRLKRGPARNKDLDQRLAKLRTQSASSRNGDLEAIYRSMEALLKATRVSTDKIRGPRSFLDMCLRKMPEYIEELDAWEKMYAEQDGTISTPGIDTSTQIYDYLESIGPDPDLGWRHLRAVARADGLKAIKQGISEGLFGDDFSELLIDLCVQAGTLAEAEELVTVLVNRQYPQPTTPDSCFAQLASLRPLSTLWSFANKYGCASFVLRQYSLLLSNGNLPQDWLATREFERVWALSAQCLSAVEAAEDAVAFMNHSILLLCRRKRTLTGGHDAACLEKDLATANRQTLISALTMLAAMSSLGEKEIDSEDVSETEITKIRRIGKRLRYIIGSCIATLGSTKPAQGRFGNDLLHMALYLSSSTAREDDDVKARLRHGIEQAWRQNMDTGSTRNRPTRHRLDEIASFVSSVARSCGRGMSLASHSCLDTLFAQLEHLELDREILESMKAVAAFSLAQQTNNVRDIIYAEKLASSQSSSSSSSTGDDAPSRSLFAGYRWEETIGEWVTVSPVVERRRHHASTRQSRSSSRVDVDHGEDGTEQAPTRCRGATYGDTHSVPSLQSDQEREHGGCEILAPLALAPGRINAKKRPHPCSGNEKPRVAVVVPASRSCKSAASQQTTSTYSALDDELSLDKENVYYVPCKKRRNSTGGRVALRAQPRPSLVGSRRSNAMFGDGSSDDELCL
ncbi:hypothetical protein GGR54DRAFT_479150 [Hypoxylon sp. NC1633]|nr:hypothetical protein GGR54DRAFT_479150 [Hypoxylon sp. NC1633]